jgi:putative FmdB family regulatory protein
MPVYEYRCKSCGKVHEIEHGFNDVRPTECPSCGGELIRVFHPIGVVFKGSGFHKTDYATASGGHSKSKDSASSSEGGGEAKKTDGKTSDAKPSESKLAPERSTAEKKDAKPPGNPSAT